MPRCAVTLASVLAAALWYAGAAKAEAPQGLHIKDANLQYDETHVAVVLEGSAALGEPRVRTRKGQVRVWFPKLHDHLRFDLEGDGGALRSVNVRPGAGTTYLVKIRLGDRRKLDKGLVRVTREGSTARIRIPLAALAPVHRPAATETTEPAPADARAPTAPAAAEQTDRTDLSADQKKAAMAKLPTKKARRSAPAPLATSAAGGGLNVMLMVGICGVLLLVLGALKLWQRRAGGPSKPVIDVVASRKLGPGHQLMIVRAFGKDHLLSVNGKTTERIASEPAGAEGNTPEPALADELPSSGSLLSKLMPPALPDMEEEPAPSLTPKPRFGDELLKLARTPSTPPAAARNSDAVAGLLRLRERAGR